MRKTHRGIRPSTRHGPALETAIAPSLPMPPAQSGKPPLHDRFGRAFQGGAPTVVRRKAARDGQGKNPRILSKNRLTGPASLLKFEVSE